MRQHLFYVRYTIVVLFVVASCKDPYYPNIENKGLSYLVIEGTIFDGSAVTSIQLSRTVDISSKVVVPVGGAAVNIEDEENNNYRLYQNGSGIYSATLDALHAGRKYRLRIKTTDGKEYLSEYVLMKSTPEIDNINWQKNLQGVLIELNTHDDENNTRYYRWLYEQTWEFHSPYVSGYDYDVEKEKIIERTNGNALFKCWRNENSQTILIGSTAGLSKDVIANFRLVSIPLNSWQLSVLYSIIVKQYAMTEKEYQYWQKIRKNTEDLGSIFDPQPSEIPGNIKCISDPGEPVIGYIGACIPKEKRIFISNSDVSPWIYRQPCYTIDVLNDPDSLRFAFGGGGVDPVTQYKRDGDLRYTGAEVSCIDCTLRGVNVKPSFWP